MRQKKKKSIIVITLITLSLISVGAFLSTGSSGKRLLDKVFKTEELNAGVGEKNKTSYTVKRLGADEVRIEDAIPHIEDYDNREEGRKVIPDRYNTGCDLTGVMRLPSFYEKKGLIEETNASYVMNLQGTSYNENHIIFENVYFSDLKVFLDNNNTLSPTGTVEFINCFFGNGIQIPTDCTKTFIFRNCDFLSSPVVAVNAAFYSCKFYESIGDALQVCFNVKIEDCYIFDNGYDNPEINHADGIQIAGFGEADAHDIYVDNVRIEMPQVSPNYGANSALIIKMDYADGYDMEFKNMILNGGAFTFYYVPNGFTLSNIQFENILGGYTYQWGYEYFVKDKNGDYKNDGLEGHDAGRHEIVYASSVWQENEKIRFCITNETEHDREIRVETNYDSFVFNVPRVLFGEEIREQDASFYECNIDLEFEVPNADYIKIYDGDTLIRYKVFED